VHGAAAGGAAGAVLGLLEVGALLLSAAATATVVAVAHVLLFDALVGLQLGFLLGLLSAAVPPGRGPLAVGRRFFDRGPGGRRVRAAAAVMGLTLFFHASSFLGTAFAGRFRNATLASALLVCLQVALLLPALAAASFTERLLARLGEAAAAATVVLAAASIGVAAGRSVGTTSLWIVPGGLAAAYTATEVGRWVSAAGRPRGLAVAASWLFTVLAVGALLAFPTDPGTRAALKRATVVAGHAMSLMDGEVEPRYAPSPGSGSNR
jgi:hypothetical protein